MSESKHSSPSFSLPLATALAWAGIIPFALLSLAVMSGYPLSLGNLDAAHWLASYSLVIAVFLCGAQWGYQIAGSGMKMNLLLLSNVMTLALWIGHALLSTAWFLLLAAACFLLILAIDVLAGRGGRLSGAYLRLRALVTALVSLCLLAAGLAAIAAGL